MNLTPDWILGIPDLFSKWALTLMSDEHPGLFRTCIDAPIPFDFPSSTVCRGFLFMDRFPDDVGKQIESVREETAEFVRNCQQEETGLFIDPHLDSLFEKPGDARAYRDFRRAMTKYTLGLLDSLDAEAKYPYTETGGTGLPDANEFLEYIQTGDWDRPWGIGSHAAGQARELYFLVEDGHDEYIPALEEGVAFILSKQNPETGMWGHSGIPLYEQISGTLKVLGRFFFSMGMDIPYLERLADSCIEHHADRSFYADGVDMCFPRNVAEMVALCIEASDYRQEDLRETLADVAEFLRGSQMPDGGFASDGKGMSAIGWCGAKITGTPEKPRGNVNGSQSAKYSLGLIGETLGWEKMADMGWKSPLAGWRERVAAFKHEIVIDGDHVSITEK
jgi:hypothetical protein